MKYIALEEAFSVPGFPFFGTLAAASPGRAPQSNAQIRVKPEVGEDFKTRLADFNEYRLPEMDRYGIDIQVVSLTVPGIQAEADPRDAVEKAITANNYLAKVISENPTRFRGFAALPLQDPRAAAEELRRCVGELGFVGALVNDHTQGHYLDEPQYEVFWDALEAAGLPLYIHPGSLPADNWRVMRGYPEMIGAWSWAAETGGHALRLLYGGVFDRHPNATVILGHMGEFLPFQRSRLDSRYRTLQLDRPLERMPSQYIGTNIVFTNSGAFSSAALTGAVLEVGADAVMFSVDYPYEDTAEAISGFEGAQLSDGDRAKIAYQNAERILRL
jgi:2,3-dihydroxybenzoate decarboxylase